MKNYLVFFCVVLFVNQGFTQSKKFEKLLQENLKLSVPILRVSEVGATDDYLIFDTRESIEFKTSHLKNAKHIGYDFFNMDSIFKNYPDKTQTILVYCSIGIRSELIGEQLKSAGYQSVFNLYGGIFEWKNQSYEVIDENKEATEKVHTFSKEWSKWLVNGEKVYEK